jgi:RNA polymerase sigma factor (sigma-70 family)
MTNVDKDSAAIRFESDALPTRQSLLLRLKNQEDQASWQEFFNSYWRFFYNVALKAGLTETEAQDVVQETVLSVVKQMPGFVYNPEIGSFKSWLWRIAQRRIVDQFRKRLPISVYNPQESGGTSGTPIIERLPDPAECGARDIWEEEWQKNLMDAAMSRVKARVNPRHYQIFDLYVVKQWAATDVVRTMQVTIAHVYLAKQRISALIKKEVKVLEKAHAPKVSAC